TFEPSEGGGWRFGAVDRRDGAGGRRLRLEELSTGTKAQLLVSARLAFALTLEDAADGEPGETLPFVLDEALTTSDPRRFAELAGAVLDVVEASGRQFVYLSARPEDAELWRRAAESRPGAPLAVIRLASSAAAAERAVVSRGVRPSAGASGSTRARSARPAAGSAHPRPAGAPARRRRRRAGRSRPLAACRRGAPPRAGPPAPGRPPPRRRPGPPASPDRGVR